MRYLTLILAFATTLAWGKKPDWISDPETECRPKKELCVVGTGEGGMIAEANAKKEIAEYFETQVKASTEVTKTGQSETSSDVVFHYDQNEFFSAQVKNMTNQILEGVTIRKRHEEGDSSYALGVLDKSKAAQILRTEMKNIDEKLRNLLADELRSYYGKMKKLVEQRQELNKRYQLVAAGPFPERVTFSDVYKKRKRFIEKRGPVLLEIKEDKGLKEIKESVKKWLLENEYVLANKKTSEKTNVITGKISSEKMFLDVKGWKRFKFVLNLLSENRKGEKIGGLKFDVIATGRSFKQALENALPKIVNSLEENLDNLNLD